MGNYDDIINLKRPISKHPKMSLYQRSAQFAPFAALTGYEDSLKEVARLTDRKIELSEEEKWKIGLKIDYLINNKVKEEVEVLYFVPDSQKEGGSYQKYIGVVRGYDQIKKAIKFKDKTFIDIDNVISIENELLEVVFQEIDK